jgi:hypothetical protein
MIPTLHLHPFNGRIKSVFSVMLKISGRIDVYHHIGGPASGPMQTVDFVIPVPVESSP